ncbi:MAG: penicillin-binding protein 2 [Alphaproteobacteria bacterium]|nr:penicillin-binding protein 2 [Alphaproteobacteria bacterium]
MARRRSYGPIAMMGFGRFRRRAVATAKTDVPGWRRPPIETGRSRLVAIGAGFLLLLTVMGGRLIELTLLRDGEEPRLTTRGLREPIERGDIVDRNGILLATNLKTSSLYANPRRILDAGEAARALAKVFPELDVAEVRARLAPDKSFVWVKRGLTPAEQQSVYRLGIPGLAFQSEYRRVYPHGRLAAHVLGFANVDNEGLAGVEKGLDGLLKPSVRDLTGPLTLSIDLRVQHVLTEELAAAVEAFSALGAAGLVTDIESGEVLAMVSLPDFDPNRPNAGVKDGLFNRATLGIYEMGSTFKTFTLAMALDSGAGSMASRYDATEPMKISRFVINDYHAKRRVLTMPEVYLYSSNIGAAKIALDVGTRRLQGYLRAFGQLDPIRLEIPEVGKPMSPTPTQWREINTVTVAFGHGVAVSPLQLAEGVAAVINGGVRMPSTLVKRPSDAPLAGRRVISADASRDMRYLMYLVVAKGTGSKAAVPGYNVGGKTGTAEKIGIGGYRAKALLSSFVGAFPINAPKYLVLVILDEPHGNAKSQGYATGGWTAAPAAGRVIARIGPLLGLSPGAPLVAEPDRPVLAASAAIGENRAPR